MIPNPVRTAVALASIVLMLIVVLLAVGYCSERKKAQEARAGESVAQGRTTSAVEAINEIGELEKRGQATETEVEKAQDEIRQADPAEREAVARAALCRLQHRPAC